MKKFVLITLICSLLMISCESKTGKTIENNVAREYYADGTIKSETQVKDTLAHGLMKNYDRDGNIASVYTFKMARLNGPAVSYYPSGQLKQKMFYKDGKKEGASLWYYSTGEKYRETPYKEGKIDGIRNSYYKDGKIMAEAPYLENLPGIGLKEYNKKGELLKDNTKIIIEEENRLFADNKFILHFRLSDTKPGTNFYLGELVQGKFIAPSQWQLPVKDGNGYYIINLPKGGFRMETLVISASYKTSKSNYRVISREYNLAIDNK